MTAAEDYVRRAKAAGTPMFAIGGAPSTTGEFQTPQGTTFTEPEPLTQENFEQRFREERAREPTPQPQPQPQQQGILERAGQAAQEFISQTPAARIAGVEPIGEPRTMEEIALAGLPVGGIGLAGKVLTKGEMTGLRHAIRVGKASAEKLIRRFGAENVERMAKILGSTRTAELAKMAAGKIPKEQQTTLTGFNIVKTGMKDTANSVTAKKTTSWLNKLIREAKAKPLVPAVMVTGALISMIGSYPFAGFIKEESLQTLSLGVESAIRNEDLEGADEALLLQEEILDPNVWNAIIDAVPYANVINQLKDYWKAASAKLKIDAKRVEDLRIEQSLPPEPTFSEERNKADQEARDRELVWRAEDEEFFEAMDEASQQRDVEQSEEMAEFWNEYAEKKRAQELKWREEDSKFYAALQKEQDEKWAKINAERARSRLKWGLL